MNIKRVAIAVLWTYSSWMIGGLGEFAIGTPAILGLAVGVAGALLFALDPFGLVWPKAQLGADTPKRPISAESGAFAGDASGR
ncbi:MAG: hypothetical protein ACJ769_03010 [Chloroflexota bacterium]